MEVFIIDNYEVGFIFFFDQVCFEVVVYRSIFEFGMINSFNEVIGVYEFVCVLQEIWGYEGLVDY